MYTIKIYLKEIKYEDVNWINLAQDRNKWHAHVNTVTNRPVKQKTGNFFSQKLLASSEGLCSVGLVTS